MTLNELRYLVAVDRERHFGRAAARCFISQPTLSVAIKKLEAELGVQLFERLPGQVRPTPIGEQIVDQARRVLADAEAIRALAANAQDPLAGPFRLGVIFSIGPYLLPRLIPLLARLAPRMPLIIEENYTDELGARLQRGEVDAAVLSLPYRASEVQVIPCYREEFVVAMPPGHPWTAQVDIGPAQLADENVLLLGPRHCFRDQVLALCPRLGHKGGQRLEGSSLETIRYMVASGAGISVLPVGALGESPRERALLAVRPFRGTAPYRQVALAHRSEFYRPQALQLLAHAIVDCAPGGATGLASTLG
ncbi:MAG: hydrogen peroxide-inducible genes activator [Immundisolibacter sp.]|uniref:hydrogen peroxide-inducible genes activator n=1 Tax=Immundisolibacter sp. TaxID=1934948 RepID=UPI0035649FE2